MNKIPKAYLVIMLIILLVGTLLFLKKPKPPANQPSLTPSPVITKDLGPVTAENILVSFFNYVNNNDYENAVTLLSLSSSDWESMGGYASGNSPENFLSNKESILKQYCEAIQTCLKAKPIKVVMLSDTEYRITTQFINQDGSIFVLGPCCGATEETMPSRQEFEYTVMKIDGEYKVANPPQYRP
jgi:hypothetical protein